MKNFDTAIMSQLCTPSKVLQKSDVSFTPEQIAIQKML